MLKKLINKFVVGQEIYKRVEEEAVHYHNLWQEMENDKQKLKDQLKKSVEENYQKLDIIRQINEIIKGADKRNKAIKEISKVIKGILK